MPVFEEVTKFKMHLIFGSLNQWRYFDWPTIETQTTVS